MMDDDKNKNGVPDYNEDDSFDDIEYTDADFEEVAFDDDSVDGEDDLAYENEDFGDEEWAEEPAATSKKQKKEKSLYTTGEKKGLSFNAMVIIGALLVGGAVMIYTVTSKTAEVASNRPETFRSRLNISEIMDGSIFGKDTPDPADGTAAPDAETPAAIDDGEGFLNNPDAELPPVDSSQTMPPAPSPIAPSETAILDPLTPMPSDPTPRGPDDVGSDDPSLMSESPPVVDGTIIADTANSSETPTGEAVKSQPDAQDILAQAIANRAAKKEETIPDPVPVPETPPVIAEPPVKETIASTPEPIVPIEKTPDTAAISAQAVKAMEDKIATLLQRIDELEGNLGSVKDQSSQEKGKMERTIESLQEEITALKNKPAPEPVIKEVIKEVVVSKAPDVQEKPSVATPASVAVKKKSPPARPVARESASSPTPAATSGRWELRAAQPGRAWVSKTGQRDMQSVVVGATLPGLGRVTAITYQNGRWSVQGTQGQIVQ